MQKKAHLVREGKDFVDNFQQVFQKHVTQINTTEARISPNEAASSTRIEANPPLRALNFSELIEKRLGEFVKMIRSSEGSNLYNLLIQEVEKPLIKLVLKETSGNQVQAAQLLGMHRNTLRKKIKELKIPVLKKSQ